MARQKKPALILSFARTTDAMAAEKFCMANNLPGRLIPVPGEITAGCGLAWKADPKDEALLTAELTKAGLAWDGSYRMEL